MQDILNMELVNTGLVCPYCSVQTVYADSAEVYSRSFGMIYLCRPCKAWVGVHKGTDMALGRLANEELREAKKEAHKYFDPLWIRKMRRGFSKNKARNDAYKWLPKELGIEVNLCHIGMFDTDMCMRVIETCKKYYR